MGGACGTYGGEVKGIQVDKSEGIRALKPGNVWEDNIRIYLKGTGWETVDWIDLTRDGDQWRDVNGIMSTWLP